MEYKNILEEEIKKLNKAMKYFDSINLIDKNNTLLLKKQNQKKLNTGYSIMFDVKMDLEKIVNEMGE